ncbi:MAG: hypothetical protein V2J12_06980 [Gammaproteobacteria bacterium]|jgi:hypothetical protein|nr:hypothetical protein [Gammaproteobacteria bacterium]
MHPQQPTTFAVAVALLLAALIPAGFTRPLAAGVLGYENRQIPKQVALIVEDRRVIASNTRLGRMDPVLLEADEVIETTAEAEAVLLVITNHRLLGYGPVIGWRMLAREPGEPVESVVAADFAAFVTTGARYLNFNAANGIWAAEARSSR